MYGHACQVPTVSCVADTNQLELPSDAGWATWAEAPKNSTDEELARKQTTKCEHKLVLHATANHYMILIAVNTYPANRFPNVRTATLKAVTL